jgi:cytochrome c peroxidase
MKHGSCEPRLILQVARLSSICGGIAIAVYGLTSLTSCASAPSATQVKAHDLPTASTPAYFPAHYRQFMRSPLPAKIYTQGGISATIPQFEADADAQGKIGSYQPGGPTATASNAFFQSLGTNGRACITCHEPASGMSISLGNINARFRQGIQDPLFAPVDGPTCPKNVPAAYTGPSPVGGYRGRGSGGLADAYKTLLQRGLIRIPLPLNAPPRGPKSAETTEFTIEVVSDPYGCNTDPRFNQDEVDGQPVIDPDTGKPVQVISVYRRPRIPTNLSFATTAFAPPGPPTIPNPAVASGNLMWDGREPNLDSQARDATLGHAQALTPPTPAQIQQIVAFERGFFSAQYEGPHGLSLTDLALGGPVVLSGEPAGQHTPPTTFALYEAWATPAPNLTNKASRESVARGEQIFNMKTFQITNDAGINALPVPGQLSKPLQGTCSTCHSQKFAGNSIIINAQQDQGVGGTSPEFGGPTPSTFLPIFKITCKSGVTVGFHGSTVETNDPGLALITGKCADVGKFTVPQLRALAAHPPYFSDGSAADLLQVVNFYDKRFQIQLTDQQKTDLVNFLNAL